MLIFAEFHILGYWMTGRFYLQCTNNFFLQSSFFILSHFEITILAVFHNILKSKGKKPHKTLITEAKRNKNKTKEKVLFLRKVHDPILEGIDF